MIKSVRHTGLVVRNLEESLNFYESLLGLKLHSRKVESGLYIEKLVGIPRAVLEWVKLEAPDGYLVELILYHSHPTLNDVYNKAPDQAGISHLAFTVAHIDHMYRKLAKKGFKCISAPLISGDGKVRVLYCYDPDGNIVELVEEIFSRAEED